MYITLFVLTLLLAGTSATKCNGPYFSVFDDQVQACYKSNPGQVNATVRFANDLTINISPSSYSLTDKCYTFNLPSGNGFPTWVEVGGFDCIYGQEGSDDGNCGWEYCEKKVQSSVSRAFQCPATIDEGVILAELYYSTGGPSWFRSDNWLKGTPCTNNWFGVTCDTNGRINYVDLRKNNLVSTQLPNSLGCLEFAKGFHFDQNFIKGDIPETFCKLSHIIYLTMPHNSLSGSIPTCFSGLIHLQHLYLQYNGLSGVLPDFSSYTGIKELHVEHNCLTGYIPQSLQTGSIIDLDFSSNNFQGCIPDFYKGYDVLYAGNRFCSGPLPCWLDPVSIGCDAAVKRHNVYGSGFCSDVNYCVSIIGG